MRVIAGTAKSLRLKTIEGLETRPTTDRIKETLFNMLQHKIAGSNFLDLYSGSGAIGIEALSRGARNVYFIENNNKAVECIKENLTFTKLQDNATVLARDVLTGLLEVEKNNLVFDYIFMDPPYQLGEEEQVLEFLGNSSMVNEDTIIIIEASLENPFSFIENSKFEVIKEKRYKTNKHIFLCLKETI